MPWLHVALVVKAVRVEPKVIDLQIIEPRPQKSWIVMMQAEVSCCGVCVDVLTCHRNSSSHEPSCWMRLLIHDASWQFQMVSGKEL